MLTAVDGGDAVLTLACAAAVGSTATVGCGVADALLASGAAELTLAEAAGAAPFDATGAADATSVVPLDTCVFGADAHAVAVVPTANVDSASLISTLSLRDAPKYLFSGAQRYQLVRAEPVRSRHIPRFLR